MTRICGVDEAGRGPLAGPVVAAAVILPVGFSDVSIRDSKTLSKAKREQLAPYIREVAIAWAVVAVGARRIDKWNILEATKLAMKHAVEKINPDLVLIDGNQRIPISIPQRTVVGGDSLHVEISAASILAKVWRDQLMERLAQKYPHYGFEKHAGYGTEQHRTAIKQNGPCRIHRRTFAGVKEFFDRSPLAASGAP